MPDIYGKSFNGMAAIWRGAEGPHLAECCLMMGLPDAETIEQIKAIRWARHVVENDP